MKMVLLCAILFCGCAATTLSPSLPHVQPVEAQFGLRFRYGSQVVPLQGAVHVTENAGSLGVIFPHGRTLGLCRYQGDVMECAPAGDEGGRTRFMLRQIGLAVYRVLSALTREAARDVAGTDWTVYWKETDTGRSAEYLDLASQVAMEIRFTELVRP